MADAKISALTNYATPLDADVLPIVDTANTTTKKLTWANIKAVLKTYFDTLYAAALGADDNYVTDAEKVVIGNTSGTNTGDNATNSQYSGLAASKANVAGSLTQFVGNTAYRVFYSDASGDITELALGADGTFLKSNGASAAPSFAVPAGSGDVSKVGTPVNNQIGVWTGDGTLEGDASLTFDTTTDTLSVAASGKIAMGAVNIIDDTAGTTTLSNIDAIDATTEATIESAIDTLANLTSVQGRTVTLADAGANAIFGWDDVASAYENLTQAEVKAIIGDAAADGATKGVATFTAADFNASSGNISIDYTNAQKASTTQPGFVTELATDAETVTGSDTARVVTPSNLVAKMAAPGAIGGTTPSTGAFTTVTATTINAFTTGGAITLAENTSVALDPAGSADGKYSGITVTGTAGYTQAFGDLVYLAVADSRWELADADASATAGPVMLAMVVSAGTDGTSCTLLLQGIIRADAKFPTMTVGATQFVGETAGAIQGAIPTGADNIIRTVGYALTADELYFNPSTDWQVTVA